MLNPTPDSRDRERKEVNKIIAGVCNARRNSDLRADDRDIIAAFTEALFTARREVEAERPIYFSLEQMKAHNERVRDKARREGEAEAHALLLISARELLALLRDKWACPDADAMTLYLGSILAGIAEEWNENPPENGFTHAAEFPGIGKLQIEIHKVDGKSATESLRELEAEAAVLREALMNSVTAILEPKP